MNIFSIESLDLQVDNFEKCVGIKAKIIANLDSFCDAHGNKQHTLKITSEANGYSEDDVLKQAIENMLNNNSYKEPQRHMPRCDCGRGSNEIVFNFDSLQEPFKSLFEDLFNSSNWTIPNKELTFA